jgi:MFS family permease
MSRGDVTRAEGSWPAPTYAWYVVAVLAVANAVSFIDRLILSLLVPVIKADLQLSDTEISLLQGFAFALFYTLMGLPLARWADARSRKWLVTVGVAFWSAMTALCGLARGFWQLFAARVGVGCGEATLSPSAYSMLADYFPPHKLALPIGVFSAGITAGMGLALIGGAAAIQMVTGLGEVNVPVLGSLGGWRLVFVIVGALGIIVIALMLTVREPARRDASGRVAAVGTPASVPLREVFGYLRAHWRLYALTLMGFGMTSVSIYGILSWTPTFYVRSYGLTIPQAGYLMGLVALVGGVSGSFAGGWIADRLALRDDPNAKLRVLLVCCCFLLPAGALSPLMPTVQLALGVLFFTFFFGSAATGPTGSFVQIITPNRMRAQMGAVYQLALNLVGLGLGPTAVALFTDYVFGDENMVRYSIVAVVMIFNPLAIVLSFFALRHYAGGGAQVTEPQAGGGPT